MWDRLRIGSHPTTPQPSPAPSPGELTLQALEVRLRSIEQALETGLLLLE